MTDLKAELHRKLQAGRAGLLSRLEGLTEYDMRRPMTPTAANLLGLVKHLAGLEYGYLGESFDRPVPERLAWVGDGSIWEGADMWARPDDSSTYIIGLYERACAHADRTITDLALETPGQVPHWPDDRRAPAWGCCSFAWFPRLLSMLATPMSCENSSTAKPDQIMTTSVTMPRGSSTTPASRRRPTPTMLNFDEIARPSRDRIPVVGSWAGWGRRHCGRDAWSSP